MQRYIMRLAIGLTLCCLLASPSVVLVCLACSAVVAQERAKIERPRQVMIALKLYEGDPRSKRAGNSRLLAEPVFVATSGQPASFLSGGEEALRDHPQVRVRFGTRCETKATILAADKVLLELMLERSEPLANNAAERLAVQGDVFRSAAILTPGRSILIEGAKRPGKPLWLQIKVDVLPDETAAAR